MIKKDNELEKLKPKIIKILKDNGVKKAGIFGSYAKGEQKKNSDIDILIDLPKGMSLFDVVGVELKLEDALNKKIDLLTYGAIHKLLKDRILNEEIRII